MQPFRPNWVFNYKGVNLKSPFMFIIHDKSNQGVNNEKELVDCLNISNIGFGLSLTLQSAAEKINIKNILDQETTLQVRAYWEPIADSALDLPNYSPENAAIFNNLSPAHPSQEYEADAFTAFFPNGDVTVGDLWELDVNKIVPFLRQFHPGATAEMHLNPGGWYTTADHRRAVSGMESDGGFACLRALSSDYAEIVFRVHAEFLLDKDAPAYFTPAQFTGRLVLNRNNGDNSRILALSPFSQYQC